MSYFDQMMASSGMFSPQAMNYAGQMAVASQPQDDGFWTKLRNSFGSVDAANAMLPIGAAADVYQQAALAQPQVHSFGSPHMQQMQNPGASALHGLLAAIMQGGFR